MPEPSGGRDPHNKEVMTNTPEPMLSIRRAELEWRAYFHAIRDELGVISRPVTGHFQIGFIVTLCAGFVLFFGIAQGQTPIDYFANESIQIAAKSFENYLDKVSEQKSKNSDTAFADAISAFRMLLDFSPKDRHRFVLPRQIDTAKANSERVKKLFDPKDDWTEFQKSFDSLVDAVDQAADSAESKREWEAGFRLRWQLAGLTSLLPASANARQPRKPAWTHSEALESNPVPRRAFANHPRTLWPASSYSAVNTPHFEIASQSDPKSTLEVAVLCEQSFAVWKQLFFKVWSNDQAIAPKYAEALDHKFSVVLFRNREAYGKALRSVPGIGISTGYYDPNQKTAFFYWEGTKTPSTVVHELTHQFFYEASAKPIALDTDRGLGFWVIEGVALYMESMSTRTCGGGLIADVGGWDSPRLQAGRYRRLHDKYWVPWDEFHSADGQRMRSDPDIRAWYSQATGLAHLFLDGTNEQRQSFAQYIDSVYANNESTAVLGELNDDGKLKEAYDRFLISGPSMQLSRPFFNNRREAVLSRSRLTSQQIMDWPIEFRTTPWLDLSFSQIDDELFVVEGKSVTPSWNVQRLNLESTKVTDISMPSIAESRNLSELDLSNCAITDAGLVALKDHKSLRALWLNQCDVSDNSIAILLSIPQLEAVHLMKTKVSPIGWGRLMTVKPRLKGKSTGP